MASHLQKNPIKYVNWISLDSLLGLMIGADQELSIYPGFQGKGDKSLFKSIF